MSNPTISQIKVGDITYDLCDTNLRNTLFNSDTLKFANAHTLVFGDSSVNTGDEIALRVTSAHGTYSFIRVPIYNNYGNALIMGSGGLTCIGGGEAAGGVYNALIDAGTLPGDEQLHLASDNAVYFHSNCQTVANRKTMTLDTSGNLNVPGTITLGSKTANTVFAAPNGSNGSPTFRTLVAADIPNLNASKITAGTLPLTRGGTGATTKLAAFANIGAWSSSLGSTSGTTSKNITITGYNELLICATYSSTYRSTIVVPTALIDGTVRDWYLGAWTTTYAASCKLSKATANSVTTLTITPYNGLIAGSEKSFTWYVYGR